MTGDDTMPCISEFFGIGIYVYYNDHLPPHFHAVYGDHEALYEIGTLRIRRGGLPRRAHAMVIEWADEHRPQLLDNWERARRGEPLQPVAPLD